jgi:NADPH:quinone reductase-like Zn-dependent oxidoreductase
MMIIMLYAQHLGATVATTTSTSNVAWVKSLGADVVVDYKKDDFEKVLSGYDVVLNSQDGKTLAKSLNVLKPGGKLITISGPADPAFAEAVKASWFAKQVIGPLSLGTLRMAKRLRVDFSFLFMKANGSQLKQITPLIESGAIRPVIDKVFPFAATNEALAYVESGRAKGKVVIKVL